ncbi:MAG TPA: muconolactone Delta-isomerase family protein [Ramlibacter sp.]|nr:muconolactone Delta-isomerase family protein [Ramlibacter sp.]
MLFLLDVEIDYARMGDQLAKVRAAEHARVQELIAEGVVVVEWLKADRSGVWAIWDCASEAEARELAASVPMAPYLSRVDVHPVVEHPLFPGGRPA